LFGHAHFEDFIDERPCILDGSLASSDEGEAMASIAAIAACTGGGGHNCRQGINFNGTSSDKTESSDLIMLGLNMDGRIFIFE
jgi:hypothetical protein